MEVLFTIGYQIYTPKGFADRLKFAGVEVLADVRRYPNSRNPGFQGELLEHFLAKHGIEYRWFRDAGNPFLPNSGSKDVLTLFEKRFCRDAPVVDRILTVARRCPTALMCMEHDPNTCHRSVVAGVVAKRGGMTVVHL